MPACHSETRSLPRYSPLASMQRVDRTRLKTRLENKDRCRRKKSRSGDRIRVNGGERDSEEGDANRTGGGSLAWEV